jgi:hypothetical protein
MSPKDFRGGTYFDQLLEGTFWAPEHIDLLPKSMKLPIFPFSDS